MPLLASTPVCSSAHLCKGGPRLWHLVPAPVHELNVLVQACKAPAVTRHVLLGGQFWPLLPLSHEGNNLQAKGGKVYGRTDHRNKQLSISMLSSPTEPVSREAQHGNQNHERLVSAEHLAAMLLGTICSKARKWTEHQGLAGDTVHQVECRLMPHRFHGLNASLTCQGPQSCHGTCHVRNSHMIIPKLYTSLLKE